MGRTAEILTYIKDELLEEEVEIDENSALFSSQLLDSLSLSSLMVLLEEKYGAKISPMDINYDNFDTVARIEALIERKAGQ